MQSTGDRNKVQESIGKGAGNPLGCIEIHYSPLLPPRCSSMATRLFCHPHPLTLYACDIITLFPHCLFCHSHNHPLYTAHVLHLICKDTHAVYHSLHIAPGYFVTVSLYSYSRGEKIQLQYCDFICSLVILSPAY